MDRPMNEFYAFVERLLQLPCSVEQYLSVTRISRGENYSPIEARENYARFSPTYTISRCPFCGQIYQAQFDTYSLDGSTDHSAYGHKIASADALQESEHCKHYLACDTYNYLHSLSTVVESGQN